MAKKYHVKCSLISHAGERKLVDMTSSSQGEFNLKGLSMLLGKEMNVAKNILTNHLDEIPLEGEFVISFKVV